MTIKVFRVVTDSDAIKYHMPNTLSRFDDDFNVSVIGQDVSQFDNLYPKINFINIKINRKISILDDFLALISLIKILKNDKPDIVHSLMPKAGLIVAIAGFITRTPVRVHTFTGQVWATKTGLSKYVLRKLDWLINKLNTLCLTDSLSQSQFLFDNGISVNHEPLKILSKGSLSGVDLIRFDADALKESAKSLKKNLNISTESFVFSYIARKTIDKGALDMLIAFSNIKILKPHAVLLFIGPDEDNVFKELKIKSPELFLGVIDIGSVSNHELYLCISDALCLPSHREGFGSIVIDAAAIGIPTLGTKIPGLIDAIVDGETGLLSTLGDINAFQEMMLIYIENISTVKLHGLNAKNRVHSYFSADFHYQELKKVYLNLFSSYTK